MITLVANTLLPYYVQEVEEPHNDLPEIGNPVAPCPQPIVTKPEPRPLPGDKHSQILTGLVRSMSSVYPLSDAGDQEMALLVQQLLVGEIRL